MAQDPAKYVTGPLVLSLEPWFRGDYAACVFPHQRFQSHRCRACEVLCPDYTSRMLDPPHEPRPASRFHGRTRPRRSIGTGSPAAQGSAAGQPPYVDPATGRPKPRPTDVGSIEAIVGGRLRRHLRAGRTARLGPLQVAVPAGGPADPCRTCPDGQDIIACWMRTATSRGPGRTS